MSSAYTRVRTNKLAKLKIMNTRRTVGGQMLSTYLQKVQEPELTSRESEQELTKETSYLCDLAKESDGTEQERPRKKR